MKLDALLVFRLDRESFAPWSRGDLVAIRGDRLGPGKPIWERGLNHGYLSVIPSNLNDSIEHPHYIVSPSIGAFVYDLPE